MTDGPVRLKRILDSFDEIYAPRIVGRVNEYDVKVAKARGEHIWHVHEATDEFFLVLDGSFEIAIRDGNGAEQTVILHEGDIYVVPKGVDHKPASEGGSVLMFEPAGTMSTGDRHDGEIPGYVTKSAGVEIES